MNLLIVSLLRIRTVSQHENKGKALASNHSSITDEGIGILVMERYECDKQLVDHMQIESNLGPYRNELPW